MDLRFLGLTCFALLSGCYNGPETELLKNSLQKKLDHQFGERGATITEFKRRGSQPASFEEDDGFIVYFTAQLQLSPTGLQQTPSPTQQLQSILGAGTEGIQQGSMDDANLYHVNGTSAAVLKDSQWVLLRNQTSVDTTPLKRAENENETSTECQVANLNNAK